MRESKNKLIINLAVTLTMLGGIGYGVLTENFKIIIFFVAAIIIDNYIYSLNSEEVREARDKSRIIKHADKNHMIKDHHIDEVVSYLCRDKHASKAILAEVQNLDEDYLDKEYYSNNSKAEQKSEQNKTDLINQFAQDASKEIVKENIAIDNTNSNTQESSVNRYLVDLSGDDIKLRDFKSKQVIRSIAYDEAKEIATEEDANIVIQPDDAFGYVVNKDRVTVIYLGVAEEDFALEYNINDKQAVENLI